MQIVPLMTLGTTSLGGSSLDVFFTAWLFGVIYLHLPRFYAGSFLQAFCPNKIDQIVASMHGEVRRGVGVPTATAGHMHGV